MQTELDFTIHARENKLSNEVILNSQRTRLTTNALKVFDSLRQGNKLSGADIVKMGMLEYRRRIKDISEYLKSIKSEISISENILSNGSKEWWLSSFDYKFKNKLMIKEKEIIEKSAYQIFLEKKKRSIESVGFKPLFMPDALKQFQKFSVHVALQKGRFALFEDCGLGKTFQDLVWSQNVYNHTGKPVLNLAPLAVTDQTIREGNKFGIEVNYYGSGNIQITNYEQLENVNTDLFGGIVLDESSIIKNHEGATTNRVIERFLHTPYKLCSTATPSPNDAMELGNHAEFLGLMRRSEMLSTYFVHDGGETAKWRIKGHAEDKFWKWVNTWSLMFSKPSDIGFSDEGYDLPPLNFIERKIITPPRDNGSLFNTVAVGAQNFNLEVRLSKIQRLSEIVKIVNESDESFLIWVEQNADGDWLKKELPGSVEVTGSDKDEWKKQKLNGFANNEFRLLITKTKIAGYGLNYQNCHNMIFASPDFSFEKLYQAIRRELRFGQLYPVNAYLMVTDTMHNVIKSMTRKELQHRSMQSYFIKHTKQIYKNEYELYRT